MEYRHSNRTRVFTPAALLTEFNLNVTMNLFVRFTNILFMMLQPSSVGTKATTSQLKRHNESLLLREIYARENISRVRLAEATHLSRPAVTELTQGLIEKGLVVELGPETVQDKVGKKPTLLALNPDAYHLIGIVLTDTSAIGSLLNLRMQLIHQQTISIEGVFSDSLVDHVMMLIEGIRQQASHPILGITLGIPGIINSQTGFVYLTNYFKWENLPLGRILSDQFNVPAYVGNDSNLAAVGEYRFGHGKGVKDLVVVKVGEGFGAGILADGRIIGGHSLAAGEIGHLPFPPLDDVCICGRRGCLETMVSWWGIRRHAQALAEAHPQSPLGQLAQEYEISLTIIKKAVTMGDTSLLNLIQQVAIYLGRALILVSHLLNPKMIIITGSILDLGDAFIAQVRQIVRQHTHPYISSELEIVVNRKDNESILLGAGAFLLEQELGL